MRELINEIDKYLLVQEKKEFISLSLDRNVTLDDIIEMIKKSEDKDRVMSMLDEKTKNEIEKLFEGGIL